MIAEHHRITLCRKTNISNVCLGLVGGVAQHQACFQLRWELAAELCAGHWQKVAAFQAMVQRETAGCWGTAGGMGWDGMGWDRGDGHQPPQW